MKNRFALPLLTKELYEQSARWQTYAYRVAYALLLFAAALWFFRDILERQAASSLQVLGQGRAMFHTIARLQMIGVYLFMPALTCNAITIEKERNTLGTLLLTKLSPGTIILEKLLSRMIPMLGFQLLSLPLLAYTFTLGGLGVGELLGHVWILALATAQLGAFALCCSVFASTTMGAFVMTYVLGTVMLVFFPFACCTGPVMWTGDISGSTGAVAAAYTFPAFFTTTVCFLLASNFLVTKAFSEPRNYLLDFFRHLDGVFHDMNQNFTGGIVLVNDNVSLPVWDSISWRETKKKSLGTVRYLFRILTAIELPLLVVLTMSSDAHGNRFQIATVLLAVVWTLAAILVSVMSTSLIASERSRQTLDVLMTIPASGWDIVRQKLHGVWRLVGVLTVPILTIVAFEAWWEGQAYAWANTRTLSLWGYLLVSLATPLVYLPALAMLGALMGFQFRSQARAMLVTMLIVVAVNFLPFWSGPQWLDLVIPSALIIQVEEKSLVLWHAAVNLLVNVGLTLLIVRYFRKNADRLLGRAEARPEFEGDPAAGLAVASG